MHFGPDFPLPGLQAKQFRSWEGQTNPLGHLCIALPVGDAGGRG